MKIGLIYSGKDPRQIEARDFLRDYVREHGILAHMIEREGSVPSPQISIDGCLVYGKPMSGDKCDAGCSFPSLSDIAAALERNSWSL